MFATALNSQWDEMQEEKTPRNMSDTDLAGRGQDYSCLEHLQGETCVGLGAVTSFQRTAALSCQELF